MFLWGAKDLQNRAQSVLRTSIFRFLRNLDFVQRYMVLVWFSWFRAAPGSQQNDKKTRPANASPKKHLKPQFVYPKTSKTDPQRGPNGIPRAGQTNCFLVLFPLWGPRVATRVCQGCPETQKVAKINPNGIKKVPEVIENLYQSSSKSPPPSHPCTHS